MIDAGAMRHVVRIERQSTAQDAAGQQVDTWITHAERRAAVERAPGREVWASAQRGGRVPALFRLRWLEGVVPGMRLIHEEKVHDILSATDPDGRREALLITAEERVEDEE